MSAVHDGVGFSADCGLFKPDALDFQLFYLFNQSVSDKYMLCTLSFLWTIGKELVILRIRCTA